jgi:hypothetical protein
MDANCSIARRVIEQQGLNGCSNDFLKRYLPGSKNRVANVLWYLRQRLTLEGLTVYSSEYRYYIGTPEEAELARDYEEAA